jgi:hypothetical protein
MLKIIGKNKKNTIQLIFNKVNIKNGSKIKAAFIGAAFQIS